MSLFRCHAQEWFRARVSPPIISESGQLISDGFVRRRWHLFEGEGVPELSCHGQISDPANRPATVEFMMDSDFHVKVIHTRFHVRLAAPLPRWEALPLSIHHRRHGGGEALRWHGGGGVGSSQHRQRRAGDWLVED